MDAGAVCHADFIINTHRAVEDLARIVLAKKGSLASVR